MGGQKQDDVQKLAERLGRDLYVGKDGFVRTSASETISSNIADEKATSQGSSGGCGQSAENAPDSGKK